MKFYFYFSSFGMLSILLSFLTDDFVSKISLMVIGIVWIIISQFVFKSEMKLQDIKFKLEILEKEHEYNKHKQIADLLNKIIKEVKNGNKRNSKRSK